MRKILLLAFEVSGHAGEVLNNMTRFYRVAQRFLLRVIVEGALDFASENGDVEREMAAAARFCREYDHVPDCWLSLEGERFEDGPDESGSGTYTGNKKAADKEGKQSHADYGDAAAQWGETNDNSTYLAQRLARDRGEKKAPRFPSLNGAGETLLPPLLPAPAQVSSLNAAAPETTEEPPPVEEDEHLPVEEHVDDPKPIRAVLMELATDWRSKAKEARTLACDLTPYPLSHKLHGQADLLEQCTDTLAEAIASINGEEVL